MYKYIALDLDGTLLANNHKVSEANVQVLKKLQAAGIVVMLCSGRNIVNMNFVAEKIGSDNYHTYIISDNGGGVTKLADNKRTTLRNTEFTKEQLRQILKAVRGKTKVQTMYKDGKRYMTKLNIAEAIRGYVRFGDIPKFGVPQTGSKILLIDEVSKIESIYKSVQSELLATFPNINVFRSVPRLIEITPQGSTKGEGLKFIFEKNGWDLKDLIVFGDGENDISMFEVAGHAVAMENGFDTVKAVADDICLSNENDGVANYLQSLYSEILK